ILQLERAAVDELGAGPQWLTVFHADAPDDAATLAARLSAAVHVVRCENLPLSPMFGAHTGPGTIGFAALPWPGGAPPD
ncbi:MAG: DegV family protein, partial [Candidatus Dormiibacterota bacterium]